MRTKRLLYALPVIAGGIVLCCSFFLAAQKSYPEDLLAAANQELRAFLKTSGSDFLKKGGYIYPSEKLEEVSLGEPYAVYRLNPHKVVELTDPKFFKTCLEFCEWNIPIYIAGRPATLMSIYEQDGKWMEASFGGDPKPFLDARALWPEKDGYKISSVLQIMGPVFFMIERNQEIGLYPFEERDERELGISKDDSGRYPLLTIPYVVKKLKETGDPRFSPKMH